MQPQNRWIQLPPKDPPPPSPPVPGYIEEGRYLLEILTVEEAESSYGNPYYKMECKVIHPAVHDDFRVYFVLSLTEKAMWRMREFLEAIWNVQIADGLVSITPTKWIGMKFYADLRINRFQGHDRNEVGRLYPAYPLERRDF